LAYRPYWQIPWPPILGFVMATSDHPGFETQLQASRSELARARSKNEPIWKDLHADFGDKVASVVQAAKDEGEKVLLAAQGQALASLAAAREEAGETVAAARREASTTIAAARQEAAAMVEAGKREAARMHREDDDTRREIRSTAEALLDGTSSIRQDILPDVNGPSSKPPLTERFDPRWVDQLWSQA